MAANMPPVHAVDGTFETRETCRWAATKPRVEWSAYYQEPVLNVAAIDLPDGSTS